MTTWVFPAADESDDRHPSDSLSVTIEMRDDVTVVGLDGPVCVFTAPHLDAELDRVQAAGRNRLLVDTSRIRTMSTDGLDVLVRHAQRCAADGGDLLLRDPSPVTRRVVDVCGLNSLLGTPTSAPV